MPETPKVRFLKVLLHIIFFLSGIGTVLIGQVLPIMSRHFTLNDLQVSFFFPSQFAGSLCGTLISSRLARRNNYMAAAMFGGVAMAMGALLMNIDSFVFCLLGFYTIGLGVGLTLPSINMMIVEVNPSRPAAALNFLNFCWGLGAIFCKPFVDALSTESSLGSTTIVLAVPLLVFSLMLRIVVGKPQSTKGGRAAEAAQDDTPIWRTPLAWAIALFNFIHVGFESGIGGWLTTYTGRLEGESVVHWLSPTLLYFLFFVVGRGVAPVLFRYLNENKMLFLGLSIVLCGMALTLTAHSVALLSVGSVVAGFGTSWIFPTNVSRFSKTFGASATRRATPLFMCGTLGAASVTWLIGFLSNQTGDLRYGMAVLGVSIVLLLILQVGLSLRKGAAAKA
jgi:fucose permease